MTVRKDCTISSHLWYNIGGTVKYLLECASKKDVVEAVDFITQQSIAKVFVCGQGSNLIFTDEYFDGAVIQIVSPRHSGLSRIDSGVAEQPTPVLLRSQENSDSVLRSQNDVIVEAFAGEVLGDVVKQSLDTGLIGLEWAGGLPGTVGAAVRGNVGAYGGEIKDSLDSADVLDYSAEKLMINTLTNEALQFVYRGSLVKTHKKMIVLSARFKLRKGSSEEVSEAKAIYEKNIASRKKKHPLEYRNCGSVFKNIRDHEQVAKVLAVYPDLKEEIEKKWHGKVAVASLIERLGLKGYRVGDAQVSEKHALFIVNRGHAYAKDVLQVIYTIQKKFEETFDFQLELEVEIV